MTEGRQVAPLANLDPKAILERYLAGESSTEIAKAFGVTKQAMSLFLLTKAEDDWKAAQLVKAIERKDRADELIETADNALDLSRGREMLRSAQWDLERVCRRIYAQEAPVSQQAVQVVINLRRGAAQTAPETAQVIDISDERK